MTQTTVDRLGHHGTRISDLEHRVKTIEEALVVHLRLEHGIKETIVARSLGLSRYFVRKICQEFGIR